MDNYSRDVFKKRKNKAYKNLVSYGQYGVVTALALAALATGGLAQAEEQVGTEQSTVVATSTSDSQLSVATSTESSEVLPTVSSGSESSQAVTSETVTETELTSESATLQVSDNQVSDNQGSTSTNQTASSEASSETNLQASESDATSLIQTQKATVSSEKETVPATKASSENLPLIPISNATFSWQEVPQASSLLENGAELQASGAKIVYESQPIFGSTSAGLLVTYPDGSIATLAVPITVTANAVRKTLAAAVEEGSGTRAVATSPNTSGIVVGSLTADSPTSAEYKRSENIIQTVNLSISGNQADYTGGYIEVVIDHGQYVNANPSQVTGVVIQNVLEGDKRIIRFKPSALTGGQDYNFRFTHYIYGNMGDMVTDLFETDFQVTTTAQFLDKDGLLVQDLGSNVHSYYETLNGGAVSSPYAGLQPVGYDLDKDGIVDEGAYPITFFVSTGVISQSNTVEGDRHSYGTGVFDGRYVNAVNPTQVEDNRLVAPVETYTHTIALKPGFTLSQASKDLGWVEDATGYHLTVTRDNNPVTDTNRLIPISFDIAGANVADIAGTKNLALTSTYTKTNGTVYSNTATRTHNFRVLTTDLTTGLYNVGHGILGNNSDSEIIKSYGRAYYDSRLDLSNQAMMEQKVSIDDRSFVWTTENDNEFYRRFWINTNDFSRQLDAGGVINLYNNDTGELITSITGANRGATHYSITIPEEDQVKSIRMETQGIYLWRTTEIGGQSIGMIRVLTDTFFDDWATIYNDTSINSLWSRTQLEMVDQADAVLVERHATTELVRTPMRVEMRDDNAINKTVTSRQDNSGFIFNEYNVTNLTTNKTALRDSKAFSALVGELKRAFVVSPELKPFGANLYSDVIYNYNGTGKDLYFFSIPHLPNVDNLITDNPRWTFANNFVPNGSYTVTDIGYWDEIDPNIQPTDGINLGTVNGVTITAANSTTKINTITLQASEASGVISKVKADAAASYALNTSGHQAQDVIDFQLTYSNIGRTDASQVSVLTSLPTNGDSLLAGGNRNSQFTVSLTGPVTPTVGWTAVYSTVSGTAAQMEAGTWLTADQVTDWSTIRAIKYVSIAPVKAGTSVNFNIDNAVIEGDALQGEKAYLSSASSTNGAPFIESNTVLIQMASTIADGTVTIQYVNEADEVIATEKVLKNDIKSDYDASNKETYYPTNITGTDGLPYVYVETDPDSAPNTGSYSETPKVITHVYKLVPQTATFTFKDVTNSANPVQLGEVDSETGGSGQDIAYDTTTRINKYEKQGYKLVSNDYTNTTTYDTDATVDQPFTIELRQRVVDIPDGAVPGEPVDPSDPNSPLWPDTVGTLVTELVQSRAIEYRYLSVTGDEAADPVVQTVPFTRTATVNLVTREIVYGEWTSKDPIYEEVVSPTIPGYTANIPVVSEVTGEPGVEIGIARIVYTPNKQVGKVTYIDETTGETLETVNLNGVTDQKIGYDPAAKIAEYEAKGYEFVREDVPEDGVYDNIDGNSQDYVVVLRHKIEPATPDTVDPETNAPVELSRTVTRTIEYKYIDENGAEASATVTQTATFTRTATVDMVTGEVVYADWTSADAELDRVNSPAIQGYTPNMTNVPALTVNADTEDQSVVVIYTPDVQKASVTYTDETTGATLEITNLTGETDAAIGYTTADRIAYYESIGYELVSDNYPTNAVYDKDGNVTQEFQVVLKHIVTPVTPADPTNPKDGSTLELSRTVTRTIEYKYFTENGEEASATVTQTVTFTRTATVDMVTGQVTYADWTTDNASLAQVDSPAIEGYTPNLSSIPAMTVDPNQSDIHTVVIYNADQQKARVTYYDQTSGRVLETSDLTGLSDEAIDYTTTDRIAYYESIGYRLVSNDYPDAPVYDKDGNVLQEFQVVLEHIVTPVTPENPVNPKTNQELELTRTVTRTIEYKYLTETGQEASATVTQSTTFSRTATVDMVTGQVVYTDWTSENPILDAVTSPEIPGYTANQLVVGSVQVTANQSSLNTIVVYTPDVQKASVDFIDETSGTTLHTENLSGVTDQTIGYSTEEKIAYYASIGYELVSDNYPANAVYDNIDGNSQDYKVVLKHIIEPVTPDTVDPETNAPVELSRTVTRTIEYKYIDENGQEASATVTQIATFTRTATVDKVTGEVVYADWTSADAELDRVNSPAIQGYTPNMTNVPALTVNADTEDQSVVVIYTPDVQKASVTYTDETTGATLEITNLTGVTDAAIGYTTADRIAYYESIGYELVSDNYPTDVVYDKDGNVTQEFQVVLKHIETPVTPDNPTNPKDGSTLELTRTVTRTIEYKYIDENGQEASATVTQTATFTRTATVNMVTGEVTYGDWTSEDAELDAVDSPVIDGYTPNMANVPALTVNADTEDQSVVVIYTPDVQKASVTYIDETTGATLEITNLTGETDAAIGYTTADRIAYYESIGYELVSDNYPNGVVYDKDGNVTQEFQVVLKHIETPVTPDNPTNPKDGSTLELTRTVTRTIEYKYIDENGQEASATVTQTATFTRTATVNMVTGEVTYGDWTSEDAELDAVDSPVIDGYTPNMANVPALTVDADTENQTVVVIYTPDTQKATITYIDETTGETITVDEVTGDTDSPIGYTTEDRIKALEEQGYELVTDGYPTDSVYDKDGNVDQNFTVTLRQKQVPVDPTDPTNPKDGSQLELTRTVTRTIEYKYIDENGQEASATVTQTATFTRTATVNMVTGEVTYGEWTSEDAELDAVDSPVIDGYTPNLANVPALTVDADTENQTVVVIYTPQVAPTPDPEPNPEPLPTVPDNPAKPTNPVDPVDSVYPVDPEEPVTPNLPHQTQTNSFVIQTEAKTEILSEGVTTLPETGEESQIWMAILGIIMMSMGIMIFKKKENDQD